MNFYRRKISYRNYYLTKRLKLIRIKRQSFLSIYSELSGENKIIKCVFECFSCTRHLELVNDLYLTLNLVLWENIEKELWIHGETGTVNRICIRFVTSRFGLCWCAYTFEFTSIACCGHERDMKKKAGKTRQLAASTIHIPHIQQQHQFNHIQSSMLNAVSFLSLPCLHCAALNNILSFWLFLIFFVFQFNWIIYNWTTV